MLDIKKYLFVLSEEQKVNLIAEDVDVSESDKEATMVLFENAVNEQVKNIFEAITEDFQEKLDEEVAEEGKALNKKINAYLEYVVNEWVEENKPVLNENMQGKMNNDFIEGMKKLFKESYKEIPEDRVDAHKELQEELNTMNKKFEALFDENVKLKESRLEEQKEAAFKDLTESMVETDKERAETLLENIVAESAEEYTKKAKIILEAKFTVEDDGKGDLNKGNLDGVNTKKVSNSQSTLVESALQIL